MRLASPFPRRILAFTLPLILAAGAGAAVEHRAKLEAPLFRSQALEPPPLANLPEGEPVRLLHRGEAESLVKTAQGLRGWMRNSDLIEAALAEPGRHRIGGQEIKSGALALSPAILVLPPASPDPVALDRSFADEVVETMDREQLEMRHDEN